MKFHVPLSDKRTLVAWNRVNNDEEQLKEGKGLYSETHFRLYFGDQEGKGAFDNPLGYFKFSPMPGCCGIVVSHNTYLNEAHRGGEVSIAFRSLKEQFAEALGYTVMIATGVENDRRSTRNMQKSNYIITESFVNRRTGNRVIIGHKLL